MRKPPKGKSLAEVNPELAKEWHPTKNGDLTPVDVTIGVGKKVWWKCDNGEDHEWESSILNRTKGSKCPVCSGQKVVLSNCLATLNPELAKEWHPTKNCDLTSYHVGVGSNKKVWWKCDRGDDHEWITSICQRTNGKGCPVCSGHKVVLSNCLATVNPKLAKEWHPTKNNSPTPFGVSCNSGKKAWWKCDKGHDHEWEAIIANRSKGIGCPICSGRKAVLSNCLAILNPELAKEWHPTKNGNLTPFQVTVGSNKKIWWKCNKGDDHEWVSTISNRSYGNRCPICANQKIVLSNSLATLNPELTKEWHPTKNYNVTPFDVTSGSEIRVWWKCDKGDDHEWEALINSRSKGKGCPICSNRKAVLSNCLATVNPELTKEWHPTKNGALTPYKVTLGSEIKAWWKCDKGDDHEWEANISDRTNGNGCPVCSGNKVMLSNCLATLNPELSKEWHPIKNGNLTPYNVTVSSNKKVWWKCNKGEDHEWKSSINHRTNGRECPICSGKKVVLSNCLANLNKELAKEWHPTKNGNLTPFQVTVGSGKKIWWKCDKGDYHEWITSIDNRTKGKGCPYCTLTPQSRQELSITFELIKFFDINPKGFKTKIKDKLFSIDIFIPEFNLGIEFDGNYWHKGKRELDKLKTEKLEGDGFTIMRVRQEPLKAITEIDVISKEPFNAKYVTNNILKHIIKAYSLDTKRIQKIEKYILKEEIQNEKGLDAYIDMILTEKSKQKLTRTTTKP